MTPYTVIVAGFAVLSAVLFAVGLAARRWPGPRLRPVGEALHAALAHPPVRWLAMVAWLWTGFHFLAR